jgi:hypothetical protein
MANSRIYKIVVGMQGMVGFFEKVHRKYFE